MASDWRQGSWDLCLTFIRGRGEAEVFAAFGAVGDASLGPLLRVGQAGEWLVAIEEESAEGMRSEVLRRVTTSAGHAVAIHNSLGGFAALAHADDGHLITTFTTLAADSVHGRDPGKLLAAVQAAAAQPHPLAMVLSIAADVFELPLDDVHPEAASLPFGRIVPVLDRQGAEDPDAAAGPGPAVVGDALLDALIRHADQKTLAAAAEAQVRLLLTEAGLHLQPQIIAALREVRAGHRRAVHDDEALGLLLRTAICDSDERRRGSVLAATRTLRTLLLFGPALGLVVALARRRSMGAAGWREQALEQLADVALPPTARQPVDEHDDSP
ncbi:DUF6461 domain-containing protein [[Actinomadura] parvosata]|uniref:DUF6461 domain-containing protein n=1 Tax=[Actinomadura] parvosata TaxID=1955412 RepID=UPI00406C043C